MDLDSLLLALDIAICCPDRPSSAVGGRKRARHATAHTRKDVVRCRGAQSKDKGRQALAFLPNEIWIHAANPNIIPLEGDSITWTIDVDEPHTVTFLADGEAQNRPLFSAAPSPSPPTFDGSKSVSS